MSKALCRLAVFVLLASGTISAITPDLNASPRTSALGNVVDRLGDGAVTDFLDIYVGRYHWPTFNFADTFIFCGVILLFISNIHVEAIADLEIEQPSSREL